MKKEPCVRLGMRIRPKTSEKPDASRNRRPPIAMLLTASSSTGWRLALQWRIVARIDGLRQILRLVIGPELADVGVSLDDGVDELVPLALDLADEDVADDVAQMVEAEGAARRI